MQTAQPKTIANGGFFSLFDLPGTVFDWQVLERLAATMSSARIQRATHIDSGLVYLGQFITHDVTLARLPEPPRAFVRPFDLVQERTPALDLDHLYGLGWDDPEGCVDHATGKMILGSTVNTRHQPVSDNDLPRRGDGKARIPDERNDENLLLAQLHVQFLKVHNALVERIRLEGTSEPRRLFDRARHNLTLYYQQVVLYDFLAALIDPAVFQHVILDNKSALWRPVRAELARIPVEFSAAAFRFAHAMVRPSYTINDRHKLLQDGLFQMTGKRRFGGEYTRLPDTHVVDWRLMFTDPRRGKVRFPNKALPIDPTVTVEASVEMPGGSRTLQLADADLRSGNRLLLPDAQSVVGHIIQTHPDLAAAIGLRALSAQELNPTVEVGERSRGLLDAARLGEAGLTSKTPLWYYILAEAHAMHEGERLGQLGSLIVAETLRALVYLSEPSILAGDRPGPYVAPSGSVGGRSHVRMIDLLAAADAPLTDAIRTARATSPSTQEISSPLEIEP